MGSIERAAAWELASACLTFDPLQDAAPSGSDATAAAFHYMALHPEEWICERDHFHDLVHNIRQNTRTILYGETGTGKSTTVSLLRRAELGPDLPQHVVVFDFNKEALALSAEQGPDLRREVQGKILTALERSIEDSELFDRVRSRYESLVEEESPEFDAFRVRYQRETGRAFRTDEPRFRNKIVAESARLNDSRESAYDRLLERSTLAQRAGLLLRALSSSAMPVLCFDNIDPVGHEARSYVGEIAQALALATDSRLGIVVACRSEHREEMLTALDTGTASAIASTPLPSATDSAWDIVRIVNRRLDLLKPDSALLTSGSLRNFDSAQMVSASEYVKVQLDATVQALLKVHEPDRRDDTLAESLAMWNNGDIRSVVSSIIALVDHRSDITPFTNFNQPVISNRVRHNFYRHLVTGEAGEVGRSLRPCLGFFVPQMEEMMGGHRPFFFLRFRVLTHISHVLKSQKSLTVQSIERTFEQFGISRRRTRETLQWLARRDGMNSGFIRLESPQGLVKELSGGKRSEEVTVHLLPAGKYFLERLVSKVEYLFWVALEDFEPSEPPGVDIRGPGVSGGTRVRYAVSVLENHLLKRFLQEHPYMDVSHTVTPRDVERLQKFRRAFGYRREHWFIETLMNSISAYARNAGVPPEMYEVVEAQVAKYVSRLNYVETLRV